MQSSSDLFMIVIGVVVLVLLALLVLRSGRAPGMAAGPSAAALAEQDKALRDALGRAERAETLAGERIAERDKLLDEVIALRQQAEAAQAHHLDVAVKMSGIEARARADQATIAERNAAIARMTAEITQLRSRIEDGAAAQRQQAEQIARLTGQTQADAEALAGRRAEAEKAGQDIAALRLRLEEEQRAQRGLQARIAALEAQIETERVAADDKIALLSAVRDDMQDRFRQMADEALKTQGEAFSKANVERLEATLTPLKEHVGHFEKELREVHQETVKDRERLKTEISQLTQRSEAISQEALALTRALRGDHQQQGAWGEMILESILERSGLREGEEYETQAHRTSAEGERLRPDVVVNVPGGKSLVIDSKVSLNDYVAAVNAADEPAAALSRKRHAIALRNHISGLSAKAYHLAEGVSVDYVIMFVPIEGALCEALREDGRLTEYALERHVTIATPTTLMMALRTVSHVWAVERRNRNAEDIARRAGLLYDKVAGFVGNLEKVGKGIESAQIAYDSAFGQLSRGKGNLLSQVEMLKALGGKATKTIPAEFEGKAEALALSADAEGLITQAAE